MTTLAAPVEPIGRVVAWRLLTARPCISVLPAFLPLFGAAVLLRRHPRAQASILAFARVAVPLVLAAVTVRSGVQVWHDTHRILGSS